MNEQLLERIKGRGYWQVIIRPSAFVPERVPRVQDCLQLVQTKLVRLRGWDFPHIELNAGFGNDYVESATDWMHMKEFWRFFQSGQFVFVGAFYEDWVQESDWFKMGAGVQLKPGVALDILDALYKLTEIYEFAARLAQSGLFDDTVVMRVALNKLQDRQLIFWPGSGRRLSVPYTCRAPDLAQERTFAASDLLGKAREYSLHHFLWVMERFGFAAPEAVFRKDQDAFLAGRIQ